MIKNSLKVIFLFIISIGMMSVSAFAEMKWDMATEETPTALSSLGDAKFAETLMEKTNGEINVTVHYGGALGYKFKDQYDAVSDGALQIADTYSGSLVGYDAIWQVSALPFQARSIDEAWMLYQASKPYYQKALNKANQVLLYAVPWPPSGIWSKKAINSVGDLKNLKIRAYDPISLSTLKAAGASPITLSWGDVVPQLGTGGIKAVLTSADGGVSTHFEEHLSHFVEINYAAPLSVVHMNKDVWDDLSQDHKNAVMEASEVAAKHVWDAAKERVQENYTDMRKLGVTVNENPPSDFVASLQSAATNAIGSWKDKSGKMGEDLLADFAKKLGQ